MLSSFNLSLDVQPPAGPALLVNDGAAVTGTRAVWVTLSTVDFEGGANDVAEMKIWGDVDPTADDEIGVVEGDSGWLVYSRETPVMLSAGTARKTIYGRLRDDVGNETVMVSDFIDLDLDTPVIEIVTAVDRSRISKVSPYNAASFTWMPNMDIVEYMVRAVPSHGSPHQTGVLIGTGHGSINTSGTDVDAAQQVTVTITGADLEAASPGNASKVIKVFGRTASGLWSG